MLKLFLHSCYDKLLNHTVRHWLLFSSYYIFTSTALYDWENAFQVSFLEFCLFGAPQSFWLQTPLS